MPCTVLSCSVPSPDSQVYCAVAPGGWALQAMPRLEMRVHGLPPVAHQGELHKLVLELCNASSVPLKVSRPGAPRLERPKGPGLTQCLQGLLRGSKCFLWVPQSFQGLHQRLQGLLRDFPSLTLLR